MLQLGSDIKFNGLSFLHCVLIVLCTHVTAPRPGRGWGWSLLRGISMEDCGFFFFKAILQCLLCNFLVSATKISLKANLSTLTD